MKQGTHKGLRLHIGLFGRRNVGKSSILNAITRQNVSIVSNFAGTTTDPVEKPMELLPIGPVLFIDTAGIDDMGALGEMRIEKSLQVIDRTDLAMIVITNNDWGEFEDKLLVQFEEHQIPVIIAFNKCDQYDVDEQLVAKLTNKNIKIVKTQAIHGKGILDLRQVLIETVPPEYLNEPNLLGDIVRAGEIAVLVVPIDKEAPKGRLILPQVQSIRNLLDNDAFSLVVKERELRAALGKLNEKPKLVVTDSQAFLKVSGDTPNDILMTSFSILFARMQGDLVQMVKGAMTIEKLKTGDDILIAESCSHHPIGEDIGRVKIPRWLTQYVGGKLNFHHVQGHDFPKDLTKYKLLIHCGACMWNRREMLSRIYYCTKAGVPITNYGLTIAYSLGIFERALKPFPAALEAYQQNR